jgi:hypothetical protein
LNSYSRLMTYTLKLWRSQLFLMARAAFAGNILIKNFKKLFNNYVGLSCYLDLKTDLITSRRHCSSVSREHFRLCYTWMKYRCATLLAVITTNWSMLIFHWATYLINIDLSYQMQSFKVMHDNFFLIVDPTYLNNGHILPYKIQASEDQKITMNFML